MSPFWAGLFDNLKERGRNATLFLVALVGLMGLLILGGILEEVISANNLGQQFQVLLAILGVLVLIWFGRLVRRALFGGRGRTNISRLSSDELSKARSKLMKNRGR